MTGCKCDNGPALAKMREILSKLVCPCSFTIYIYIIFLPSQPVVACVTSLFFDITLGWVTQLEAGPLSRRDPLPRKSPDFVQHFEQHCTCRMAYSQMKASIWTPSPISWGR